MHTHFRAFFKKFFEKSYPFTCSHWEVQNYRVFMKIFYLVKSPLTYLELQSQMTPYFTEKMRKYFYSVGSGFTFLPKKPLHLFPLGTAECTPWIAKNFIPSLIWNWEIKTQPVFQKKGKNFFEKTVCLKNIPSLVPTGRGYLGIVISKKGKKICPPT